MFAVPSSLESLSEEEEKDEDEADLEMSILAERCKGICQKRLTDMKAPRRRWEDVQVI